MDYRADVTSENKSIGLFLRRTDVNYVEIFDRFRASTFSVHVTFSRRTKEKNLAHKPTCAIGFGRNFGMDRNIVSLK